MEIRQGYDLKLRGRVSRYRLVRFGPFRGVRKDELIVQRHHPRTMRAQGRQMKVKLSDVEALCTGMAWDYSGPLWQEIIEWLPRFPKMPGRYAVLARPDVEEQHLANVQHDMEA